MRTARSTQTYGTRPCALEQQSSSDARESNGKVPMDTRFKTPEGVPRLFEDSIMGTSGYQARLDHLNAQRALPSAATPVAFTTNVPVKESEAYNGFYYSKWIAREHANFVVEASVFLSRVPGVAGGIPSDFPLDVWVNEYAQWGQADHYRTATPKKIARQEWLSASPDHKFWWYWW